MELKLHIHVFLAFCSFIQTIDLGNLGEISLLTIELICWKEEFDPCVMVAEMASTTASGFLLQVLVFLPFPPPFSSVCFFSTLHLCVPPQVVFFISLSSRFRCRLLPLYLSSSSLSRSLSFFFLSSLYLSSVSIYSIYMPRLPS